MSAVAVSDASEAVVDAALLAVASAAEAEGPEPTDREIAHRAALARIEKAEAALDAALALKYPTVWGYVAAKYEAAMVASAICDDQYPDAEWDDAEAIIAASRPVYDVLHNALDGLAETDAPDWPGLALKARALAEHFGNEQNLAWARSAIAFADAAEALGSGPRGDLDFLDVLQARGHAEKMAYHLAHDRDGYAGWAAFGGGTIARVAALAETIQRESRALAKAAPAQEAMSTAVIGAVWFDVIPGVPDEPDPVEEASDDFSNALREQMRLEDLPERDEAHQAAWAALNEAEDRVRASVPTTRAGVASQLLAAIGDLDVVRAGTTEDFKEQAEERIRSALVSAIRVLGLPFDYRAAEFYVGDRLADLDGRDRPGAGSRRRRRSGPV